MSLLEFKKFLECRNYSAHYISAYHEVENGVEELASRLVTTAADIPSIKRQCLLHQIIAADNFWCYHYEIRFKRKSIM